MQARLPVVLDVIIETVFYCSTKKATRGYLTVFLIALYADSNGQTNPDITILGGPEQGAATYNHLSNR